MVTYFVYSRQICQGPVLRYTWGNCTIPRVEIYKGSTRVNHYWGINHLNQLQNIQNYALCGLKYEQTQTQSFTQLLLHVSTKLPVFPVLRL